MYLRGGPISLICDIINILEANPSPIVIFQHWYHQQNFVNKKNLRSWILDEVEEVDILKMLWQRHFH